MEENASGSDAFPSPIVKPDCFGPMCDTTNAPFFSSLAVDTENAQNVLNNVNNLSMPVESISEVPITFPTECPVTGADASPPKLFTPLEAFVSVRQQRTPEPSSPLPSVPDTIIDNDISLCEVVNSDEVMMPLLVEDDHPTVQPYVTCDWLRGSPRLVAFADKDYHTSSCNPADNYLRGCLWSPDGSCILTNSRDNILRIFNLPLTLLSPDLIEAVESTDEIRAVLTMRENELVYDYTWYPTMHSANPSTCCFASTVRRNPIRLWDAFTGVVRATYRPINHLGELVSAYSIAFSADGQKLYSGFNRFMHVFDVCRPGRDSVRRPKLGKKPCQGGIISCIAVPREPNRQIYATGSYNGTVAVFSEPGNLIGRVQASPTGITQVLFGNRFANSTGAPWYLAAGSRMDSRIFLWDARRLDQPLFVLHRRVENHQRFQFDIDPSGRFLFTGCQTGVVCVYDLPECLKRFASDDECIRPAMVWRAHVDCAHGVSVHPSLPIVATASGQRRILPPFKPSKRARVTQPLHPRSDSSTSDEMTDSENDQAFLTDDEAALLPSCNEQHIRDAALTGARSLPFTGYLTRLPRENRLDLWAFPTLQQPCE